MNSVAAGISDQSRKEGLDTVEGLRGHVVVRGHVLAVRKARDLRDDVEARIAGPSQDVIGKRRLLFFAARKTIEEIEVEPRRRRDEVDRGAAILAAGEGGRTRQEPGG